MFLFEGSYNQPNIDNDTGYIQNNVLTAGKHNTKQKPKNVGQIVLAHLIFMS